MPMIWQISALVARYEWCVDEGDTLSPTDIVGAVECYWMADHIKDMIYEEALRFRIPLPLTGCWRDDFAVVRAFIAGGGWQ